MTAADDDAIEVILWPCYYEPYSVKRTIPTEGEEALLFEEAILFLVGVFSIIY